MATLNCAYWPYELLPKETGQVRKGALLRFDFPDVGYGYADCHPWESLGDAPLDDQLRFLSAGRLTLLTQRSRDFANQDALARATKENLWTGLRIPPSYLLIQNWKEIQLGTDLGFSEFKIKLPTDLPSLKVRVRLDWQNQSSPEALQTFLHRYASSREQVVYSEDPFPWDPLTWKNVRKMLDHPLAVDRQPFDKEQSDFIRILKPAIQNPQDYQDHASSTIYTSYLDHPIGTLFAMWEAARRECEEPCGFASHLYYEPNEFSDQLVVQNNRVLPPEGTGIGFDEPLRRLAWIGI